MLRFFPFIPAVCARRVSRSFGRVPVPPDPGLLRRLAWLAALFAALVAGTAWAADPAPAVYVWQRQWTPALRAALADSRDLFGEVRVLVAQAGRGGRWLETQADPSAFSGDRRERIAVIRYDGTGAPPEAAALGPYLDRLLARWRAEGMPFAGVEIDYDCATAQLSAYAARLRELREALPAPLRLSATTLPAWLDASELDAVLDALDEAVLQVHAVQQPERGLFDAATAERWARAFAVRTRKPFRIALPAYGARLHLDGDGAVLAVESEMRLDSADRAGTREVVAEPDAVVGFLARLAREAPAHWRGVVWFRLPVAGDRRAWTLAALREVIAGEVPQRRFETTLRAQPGGVFDVAIRNRGGIAAPAPALHLTGGHCAAYDGVGDWRVRRRGDVLRFESAPGRLIAPGSERAVGWLRCAQAPHAMIEPTQGSDGK